LEVAVKEAKDFKNTLPASEYDVSPNRLIISKIGVNAPIVESKNADYGLSRGAWRVPETSTPDKGGNTVITGHRFKYLPPNNLTFYLLDKMEPQDIITVLWQDKEYFYRVSQKKIISPDQTQILNATKEPVLTLYTCDPVYSQKNRLVVVAELIED
jgi:sortase A